MSHVAKTGKGELTKRRLIEAAAYLFHRRGYAAVGLNDILKLARAPKGVLYHHFPSGKAGLGVASINYSAEIFNESLVKAAGKALTPQQFIVAVGELTAADLLETKFEAGCPLATIALETAPANQQLSDACRAGFDLWLNTLEARLSDLGHASPRACAELLLTSLEGALAVARTQKDATIVHSIASRVAQFC